MSKVERAVLSGQPYERGVTHGDVFRTEIETNAEFYFDHFADHGVDEETALTHAARFIELIEEMNGAYADEMRGVADGSGLSLEAVTLINVRHTILYSAYATEDSDGREAPVAADHTDGCTSFGVQPERTRSGNTLIGQNWDWQQPVESVIMDVRQDDGTNFIALTEAGMVGGKFGVNEHGIGFVANGLSTPGDGTRIYRKPGHVRSREILEAERLDLALAPVLTEKRPTSRNYLIAHESGEMIDLETTPDDYSYLYPEDHLLTHANHFERRDGVESILEQQIPHTLCRGMRIRRLLDRHDEISEETIKEVLRDHVHYPKSICRHVSPDDESISHTNNSLIMDLCERRLLATDGPPCEAAYHEYTVTPSA